MALPEVKNLKNARYLIGYKATQKSMRPDCIQDLSSLNGTGPVERLGTNNGKKKKKIIDLIFLAIVEFDFLCQIVRTLIIEK